MAWQPQEEPLRQLSRCLKDSLSGHNKKAQMDAEIMLAQAKSSPDINNYLTYIFSSSHTPQGLSYTDTEFHSIRSAAAVMLKNNIRTGYKSIPETSLALIRSAAAQGLQDRNSQIRSYAGNVITEIVARGGILGWPELLPDLMDLIGNRSGSVTPETQEGAMAALLKICEDNKKILDKDYQGQRPLNVLIPKLIEFTSNAQWRIRSLALKSINVFIPRVAEAILVNLDALLNQLFQLANDQSSEVRSQLCRAFVLIAEIRPEKIEPHIPGLVDYMIAQQRKIDEGDLACDAAEFWLAIGEHSQSSLWKSLGPYLDKIIPVLLDSMAYSEDDLALLESGRDDADEEDREQDIKPTFAKVKDAKGLNGEGDAGSAVNAGNYSTIEEFDDFDEGEIEESEDEEDDDGDPEDPWNLRKCSAAALDVFATDFRGRVFEIILPYLMTNLKHEDWLQREAAVLALGAVAGGCMDVVTPHLPDLIPYLISLLDDREPLLRQITCWTLGRYSAWAAGLESDEEISRYFVPMMEGILKKMLDPNKRVQEASASAFAHLEEKAGRKLIPYCGPIVQQFVYCFEGYKDRNMFILYDCVQTLAEHVGPVLAQQRLVDLLMPALTQRWHKVSDQSRELFPLLECLSYVATALGISFAGFAPPIFSRCVKIIHLNLQDYMLAVNNPNLEQPDPDFLVTSLDLLSAIVQALDSQKSGELVSNTRPPLFEMLAFCMESPANDVRQSSYALLGDCARYVFPQLQPFLPQIMPILTRQLDLSSTMDGDILDGFSVVNNACWSAGEITIQNGKGMAPYVEELFQRLLEILLNRGTPDSVNENGGIAIGRLGLGNSEVLAPHLALFAAPFLTALEHVEYTEEKASAFTGFTLIVGRNPQAMEKDLVQFFKAIARYRHEMDFKTPYKEDLRNLFAQVLNAYKAIIPDFEGFLGKLPPQDLLLLRSTYKL